MLLGSVDLEGLHVDDVSKKGLDLEGDSLGREEGKADDGGKDVDT